MFLSNLVSVRLSRRDYGFKTVPERLPMSGNTGILSFGSRVTPWFAEDRGPQTTVMSHNLHLEFLEYSLPLKFFLNSFSVGSSYR